MSELPRSTPSAEGVDARGIEAVLDDVATRRIELHSLMILRHGKVIAEGWWEPYGRDDVHLLYSLSKSLMSTALGFAVDEGLVSLDSPLVDYFPQYAADATDPGIRSMRVRDAAMMASGHLRELIDEVAGEGCLDPVQGFLRIPTDVAPGSWFVYSQPSSYSVGAAVQDRSGQTLSEFLRPRLFEPLGIERTPWHHLPGDPREAGFVGLHLTTESIAKFGQLLLQGGEWEGRQLLPEGWVEEATAALIDTSHEVNEDWRQGYGFQFWRSRHGFRGDGAFGQFCLVLPEQDTVIAVTAATQNAPAVLEALWTNLIPALDDTARAADDERLARRLTSLAIDTVGGGLAAAAAPFEIREPVETPEGWRLELACGGEVLDLRVGSGSWVRNEIDLGGARLVIAARGSWARPGVFSADLVFVETPHRAVVRWQHGKSYARWFIGPLLGLTSLRELATTS